MSYVIVKSISLKHAYAMTLRRWDHYSWLQCTLSDRNLHGGGICHVHKLKLRLNVHRVKLPIAMIVIPNFQWFATIVKILAWLYSLLQQLWMLHLAIVIYTYAWLLAPIHNTFTMAVPDPSPDLEFLCVSLDYPITKFVSVLFMVYPLEFI